MDPDGEDPGTADVAGRVIVAAAAEVEGFEPGIRESAKRAFAANGVAEVCGDEWYPLAAFRDALATVAAGESASGPDAVRSIGRRIAGTTASACESVPAALTGLDDAYRTCHRGDAGGYDFRRIGERDGRVECETPYPCPFDSGFVAGVAAAGTDDVVRLSAVGVCRDEGSPRCTFELRW